MGRSFSCWGYVVSTFGSGAACVALVACGVETTTIEKHEPAPAATEPTPAAPNGATPGSSGTSGATADAGSSGSSGGTSGTSGGTSGSSGTSGSGGTSGSSGTSGSTGGPFDNFQQHNLAVVNMYRATLGVAPVTLDLKLSTFALAGSTELSSDHTPHQHFITAGNNGSLWTSGFMSGAAENQGDPNGWYKLANDPTTNELDQIDAIQKAMFDEGPGAGEAHGHYTNMMNPQMHRLGVGLLMVGTSLYLTNDFSE